MHYPVERSCLVGHSDGAGLTAGNRNFGPDDVGQVALLLSATGTDEFIRGMGAGVPILGTVTKKCKVKKEAPK